MVSVDDRERIQRQRDAERKRLEQRHREFLKAQKATARRLAREERKKKR